MKARTYNIIFGRPPIGGEASLPSAPGGATVRITLSPLAYVVVREFERRVATGVRVVRLVGVGVVDVLRRSVVAERRRIENGLRNAEHELGGGLRHAAVVVSAAAAVLVDVESPGDEAARDVRQLARDADGHQQPRHLVRVVVEARTATAIAFLLPQQAAVVDREPEQHRTRQPTCT